MKESIKVVGMHCEHCENKVNKALLAIEGVSYAKASYTEENVVVEYDENKVSEKELKKAIKQAGFKAK